MTTPRFLALNVVDPTGYYAPQIQYINIEHILRVLHSSVPSRSHVVMSDCTLVVDDTPRDIVAALNNARVAVFDNASSSGERAGRDGTTATLGSTNGSVGLFGDLSERRRVQSLCLRCGLAYVLPDDGKVNKKCRATYITTAGGVTSCDGDITSFGMFAKGMGR